MNNLEKLFFLIIFNIFLVDFWVEIKIVLFMYLWSFWKKNLYFLYNFKIYLYFVVIKGQMGFNVLLIFNQIRNILLKCICINLIEKYDIEVFLEVVVWLFLVDWQEEFKYEMFNDNQQYVVDDGDGEECEQIVVVEDGQIEVLLVDVLVKIFFFVKVDVYQIFQVFRFVVVFDFFGNWFLNIKKILLLYYYVNVDIFDFLLVGSFVFVDV